MPILHDPEAPQPPILNSLTINGLAVATLLVIMAIVAAVWAVDDHFISRNEFNLQMRMVTAHLKAIDHRLGIHPPVVTETGGEDGE